VDNRAPPLRRMERRRPLASASAWIFVLRPPRERPIACFCSPFLCARGRTVRLDVRAVDHLDLARSTPPGKLTEQLLPDAALGPTGKAVVDRRVRTVLRRAILPTAAALQHVQDAAQHPSVVHTLLAPHVGRQVRFNPSPRSGAPATVHGIFPHRRHIQGSRHCASVPHRPAISPFPRPSGPRRAPIQSRP
jgi:hypothetical protein